MKKLVLLTGATAIVAALSVPAFAQTELAAGANATGVGAVDDTITDIEDAVIDDFDRSRDADRFGPADRRQGLFGSMALSYSGSTGNSEAQDLGIAGRVSYNQGPFAQSVGLAIEFGENDSGDKDKEEVSAIYDAQYYFNDRFYAFALGRFSVDGLVDGVADYAGDDVAEELTDLRRDGFLGFGPGYRIINTENTAWRVQAGIGVRYTQTGQQYLDDESDTDTGYIVSSRLYHRFNDMVFITNDTDYLTSDANDVATNQFGVNFRMSEQLATKVSYTTEYQSDRDIRTDNTMGVSLVYGF
ncbi:MAG: DUF481 domain-containing protein [Paracoccaceae bacterium]